MHDCLLNEVQRMIRDSARSFARDRLAPSAAERDRTKAFPRAEMAALGELGFLGMLVSEEWGGVAADHVSYVLAVEEISAADGSIGAMMALHNGLISTPLRVHGSPWNRVAPAHSGQLSFGSSDCARAIASAEGRIVQ